MKSFENNTITADTKESTNNEKASPEPVKTTRQKVAGLNSPIWLRDSEGRVVLGLKVDCVVCNRNQIGISGWLVGVLDKIELRINGKVMVATFFKMGRPDVAQALGIKEPADGFGFRLVGDPPFAKTPEEVEMSVSWSAGTESGEIALPFLPHLGWRILPNPHPWVLCFLIDALPDRVQSDGNFKLGGVAVLSGDAPAGFELQLHGEERTMPLQWGMPSLAIAGKYLQGRNADKARWSGTASFAEGEDILTIKLIMPDGQELVLGEVWRTLSKEYGRIYREPKDRLIFDIGANEGSDTWYYLRKGFRVVAVEAIPTLAESLCETFDCQIEAGRLVVEQKAVSAEVGEVELTVNDDNTEWSSAHKASKAFMGQHRTITVPGMTLAELVELHGVPYYIKIDIEGGELDAVRSLAQLPFSKQPSYLSVEANPHLFSVLQILWDLGYREFQLIRQGGEFLSLPPFFSCEGLDYPYAFTNHMSGSFGRDLPERNWVGLVEIIRRVLTSQQEMVKRSAQGENPGWYDVHAKKISMSKSHI